MPWRVAKDTTKCPSNKPWAVTNATTGRLVACHETEKSAREQQKALYVRVPESRK